MNREGQKVIGKITGLLRQVAAPWCTKCRERMKSNSRGWYCNNRECYPENREAPWCLPCQIEMTAYGYSRNGAHRWICPQCTRTLSSTYIGALDPNSSKYPIRKPGKYKEAVKLFRRGYSVRKVSAALGIHQMTAMKYRDAGLKDDVVTCECGRNVKHQGWCWWRYQQSPKRQEFMEQWHQRSVR